MASPSASFTSRARVATGTARVISTSSFLASRSGLKTVIDTWQAFRSQGNLAAALAHYDTVEVTVDLALNSPDSMQNPFRRTMYICRDTVMIAGGEKHMCFWAATPSRNPRATSRMRLDYRTGYCVVVDGQLVTLHYYYEKVVHGIWKHVRQYYSILGSTRAKWADYASPEAQALNPEGA